MNLLSRVKTKILFVLCLILLQMTPSLLFAGAGQERLDAFFKQLTGLTAEFEQTVIDIEFNKLQTSSGTMLLSRPGKFRWDYSEPYEQQIVSDGKNIWLYDTDLEQVTVKPLDDAMGDTPALLLSSDTPLEENFQITELGNLDGLEWVELIPRKQDTGFVKMRMGFDKQVLSIMELVDSFEQTTQLVFSHQQRNPKIDPAVFDFKVPDGVDVVGEILE